MSTMTPCCKLGSTGTEGSARAKRVSFAGRVIRLTLEDGRQIIFSADRFPRLKTATARQLRSVRLEVQGEALRWEELDEDILVQDVVEGRFPTSRGGRRLGAGRPGGGRRPILLRLKPLVAERLRSKAKATGRTLSEVADEALASI
jgi:hypothetical protein